MSRTCDAIGCKAATAPGKFMCLKHWRLVPLFTQRIINERFRAGKKGMTFLRDLDYLEACSSAIDIVAGQEGWRDYSESVYGRLARLQRERIKQAAV